MLNKIFGFLNFAILSLSVTPALTQSDSSNGYSVQHFTDENGLPQNSINDLLFDNDGYLWLASQVGLVRFNGSSFKLYYPNDKPVMESNILYLGKNEKGMLYFQTDDHNLYCYPGNNTQFINPVTTSVQALKSPFLLNNRKQLFNFSAFLKNTPVAPTRANPADQLSERKRLFEYLFEHNRNFYVADSSHLYFICNDSLYYYDNQNLSFLATMQQPAAQYLVLNKKFYILDRSSILAIYSDGQLQKSTGRIEGVLPEEGPNPRFRIYSCGRTTHVLSGQRLYLLTPTGEGGLNAEFLVNLNFIPNISAVEYNAGLDLLIVATHTEGFYFLRRNKFHASVGSEALRAKMTRHLFGPMALHQGKEILTDKFIFTPQGQLIQIKDTAPVWQRCLYIDRKDQVWGAFHRLPRRMNSLLHPLSILPPLDADVVDYKEDASGQLYCLTQKSLWRLQSDTFRRIFTPSRISERYESFIFISPTRLWIAGTNGLTEYDVQTKESHELPDFMDMHVRTIYTCKDGNILIGTYGQGYFYYYRGRFYRMPLDKNGFLITAHCFLEDHRGNVWIPCNKGLFKVPKADMDGWCENHNSSIYYYYYGRQDGLQTNEFNGGFNSSGIITPDGYVALLSMKGMVCFYADSLKTDIPHGSIDMTHVEVDGASIDRTDTIRLTAGYNNLLMEISCPYLGNRNNLYLQYNLSGLSDDWKQVPEDGIINFNRLTPGYYILQVRKINGFGKNNYQYRQWTLIVPPYFYRTSWFIILVGLAVLSLLFLLIQLRVKLVEKKKEIRIKAEKLRGTVARLEETVAMLQQSEQELLKTSRQREKLISLVIHDLRSPLRFLTLLAGDLHDNQANFSLAEMKDRTYWVKKGAQDIYNFSEDFLLWVTSQTDNFSISKRLFPVLPLLQEIYEFFFEQVHQKGNVISFDAADDLMIYSDPHVLITIIRNLVDNANKYTSQGTIHITAQQEASQILISVTDTGKGMSPQQVAAFLGHENLDNVKSGSQLGHKFIYDLTQRLDGTLTVESMELRGTRIELRFPAGEEPEPAE